MKMYSENELLTCWQAVKGGLKKAAVAHLLSVTEEEAVEMYSQAHRIYGYKPRSTSGIALSDTTSASGGQEKPAPVKWTRAKAVYDNPSREDIINKYLSMDI